MFKWPRVLPSRPTEVEQADFDELLAWQMDLADFSELASWQGGRASDTYVSRQLAKVEENDHTNGVPEIDELHEEVQCAFGMVEGRMESYGSAYPFELDDKWPFSSIACPQRRSWSNRVQILAPSDSFRHEPEQGVPRH